MLNSTPFDMEVRKATFSINPQKALGLNASYQSFIRNFGEH